MTAASANRATDRMDEAWRAWQSSRLASLHPSVVESLLAKATIRVLDRDETLRVADVTLGIIVAGQIGVVLRAPDGMRSVILRYLEAGDMIGLTSTVLPTAGESGVNIEFRTTRPCRVLEISPHEFRDAARKDPEMAWNVTQWAIVDMIAGHSVLTDDIFLSVRQRLARHLLDLAERDPPDFVVRATQEDLADAIGSVRAVVARSLAELRKEGLIQRDARGLVLNDVERLHAVVSGTWGGDVERAD